MGRFFSGRLDGRGAQRDFGKGRGWLQTYCERATGRTGDFVGYVLRTGCGPPMADSRYLPFCWRDRPFSEDDAGAISLAQLGRRIRGSSLPSFY